MILQLLWSLAFRPYVSFFLLAFVALSVVEQGRLRTLAWLVSSYGVAWAAEWGSINHGIPFGRYVYHYDALGRDLVIAGVPFFDSLSFSFLSYVSFSFAQFFMSPLWVRGFDVRRVTSRRLRNSVPVLLLGSLLMVVVDLIVDPVANLGRHWFLGEIYHYPDPGTHFGIPLANYGGWFVVGAVTIGLNQRLDAWLAARERGRGQPLRLPRLRSSGLFGPCFWSGIVLFDLGVVAWVAFHVDDAEAGQVKLQALTGGFIVAPLLALAAAQLVKPSNRAMPEEIDGWLEEYPGPKAGGGD